MLSCLVYSCMGYCPGDVWIYRGLEICLAFSAQRGQHRGKREKKRKGGEGKKKETAGWKNIKSKYHNRSQGSLHMHFCIGIEPVGRVLVDNVFNLLNNHESQ